MEAQTPTQLPCVIRSQRNQLRKTVSDVDTEKTREEALKEQPSNYEVHSNLRLVEPSDYLGYFSTRHAPTSISWACKLTANLQSLIAL